MKRFAVKFRRILEFSPFKLYKKRSGCIFPIYASKNEVVCRGVQTCALPIFQTHFGRSLPASFTEKVLGTISRFVRPETKLFEVSSDTFWKLSACKFYRKSSGHNFSICASKNEAVCYEVQTHFGSFHLSRFIKKVLGAFSQFMRPKTKLIAMKFRRILEVLCLQGLQKKFWATFHDLCVQKRSCLL